MTDMRGYTALAPGLAGDNTWLGAHADRYGNMYDLLAEFGFSANGQLFGCHFGTVTTPLTTAATTAIVAQQPQAWVRVPDGTLIVPVGCNIVVEATGATTQGEISIAIAQNDVGNGTSAAGTSGAISLNTAVPRASLCTPRQLATANVTAETNLLELDRYTFAASAVNQKFVWNARTQAIVPFLRGPASFLMYLGGNATTFFAQMQWLEFSESYAS